jgi:putative transposase
MRDVLIRRGERYRLDPTPSQEALLGQWGGALRFLWNLGHAQRLAMGRRCRVDRRAITAFDQINELTALRADLPWLAEVPRNVCAQVLVELDRAWQRFFQGRAERPRFKAKGRAAAPLVEPHGKAFRVEGRGRQGAVIFPKLGAVRAVIHRPPQGTPKTCAIVRDGDQWFACVSCETETADPPTSTKPAIALDVGVAHLVADSDGGFVENTKHAERMQPRIRRAQRTVARRRKGSKNQQKARAKVARLQRKVRRQREHALHVASKGYAKNHGVILVEDLKIQNMTRSAKGSAEEPGTRVAQKAGLNRVILGAGWGRFVTMLSYKVIPEGGAVLRRPAAYSSQECARCHHVDPASRVSRSLFVCTACGHTKHADTNASQVILSRWERETAVEPTVAVCGGTAARGRPAKQKLRVVRRGTRHVDPGSPSVAEAPAFMSG